MLAVFFFQSTHCQKLSISLLFVSLHVPSKYCESNDLELWFECLYPSKFMMKLFFFFTKVYLAQGSGGPRSRSHNRWKFSRWWGISGDFWSAQDITCQERVSLPTWITLFLESYWCWGQGCDSVVEHSLVCKGPGFQHYKNEKKATDTITWGPQTSWLVYP
jgi:hypothetical protein